MNKYSFILLSFSSEPFINTIQRNINIQSKRERERETPQTELSVSVLDDLKFSFIRVNAVFKELP